MLLIVRPPPLPSTPPTPLFCKTFKNLLFLFSLADTRATGYSSGALATRFHTPVGQTPEQVPQPIQRFSLTIYSNAPPSPSLREIAFCGQAVSHIPQSRQPPQDAQLAAQETTSSK